MKILDSTLKNTIKFFSYLFYLKNYKNVKSSYIPPSAKYLDEKELFNMIDASLDMWLTSGRFCKEFEKRFSKYLGVEHCNLVNSGSSANLIAITALTSPLLGDKRLKEGDEVITVAAGFPTTVNPIVQNRLVPVFVDVDIPTYNINVLQLEEAHSEKTKAVMIAHTLGNPFNIKAVKDFCNKYDLYLVEDSCDALGSKYWVNPNELSGKCGTFGDIGTFSFYPAHHITMGEGGAVVTDNKLLNKAIISIRDWGKECNCAPGQDNRCGKRFTQQHGDLPYGFDHKYVYSHLGYNLKTVDWCGAIGLAQLDKLNKFIFDRQLNFHYLWSELKKYSDYIILPEPTINSNPSWFGFPITIKEDVPFTRKGLIQYLESRGVGTRLLFGGNLTKQPTYKDVTYRIIGDLKNTNIVMERTFWIGVHPNIKDLQIEYISNVFGEFFSKVRDLEETFKQEKR